MLAIKVSIYTDCKDMGNSVYLLILIVGGDRDQCILPDSRILGLLKHK